MDNQNIAHLLGNNNINLQNITGADITINSGNEENPEVTSKKKELANTIADLVKKLGNIQKDDLQFQTKLTEDDFEGVDFSALIDAIKFDNCIVFIGPELSIDPTGKSLHEAFYESINSNSLKYNPEEGFFMPDSETGLINKMKRFYTDTFHQENATGYEILEKIGQIPFTLFISAAPDDTLHRIFDNHNKKHTFLFYNESEQSTEEPSKENPIIYNFLGYPESNGKFIFTFQQFHSYLNQKKHIKIPVNIESKVSDAVHYLFLGFNFEKWYNRLALLSFNLNKTDSYAFGSSNLKSSVKEFINKQFNISYINNNYNDFVDILLQKAHDEGIAESLSKIFVQNTILTLERLRIKAIDITKLEKLLEIEDDLIDIQQKFFH